MISGYLSSAKPGLFCFLFAFLHSLARGLVLFAAAVESAAAAVEGAASLEGVAEGKWTAAAVVAEDVGSGTARLAGTGGGAARNAGFTISASEIESSNATYPATAQRRARASEK
jgi:hypothetical protein